MAAVSRFTEYRGVTESPLISEKMPKDLHRHLISLLDIKDHNSFCRCSKDKSMPVAARIRLPMEARKRATYQEMCDYYKATGLAFSSRVITHFEALRPDILDPCSMTDEQFIFCMQQLPTLRSIDLRGCDYITDIALEAFANLWSEEQLSAVTLSHCSSITDRGIIQLGMKFTGLESFKIYDTQITDLCAWQFVANNPHLHTLVIYNSRSISDALLISFEQEVSERGFCDLQKLCVDRCHLITDMGITAIASACRGLQYLSFKWCHRITDKALQAIGTGCSNLKYLNSYQCREVSDQGLISVAMGCPNLEFLKVFEISENACKTLFTQCPKIRVIDTGLKTIERSFFDKFGIISLDLPKIPRA